MKIAFYQAKSGTFLDKVVAFFSRSEYSHCELVFSDGMFGSASDRDDGVRFKRINPSTKHWDIFDLTNEDQTPISFDQESRIRYWFALNDDKKYDWFGAILSLFGIDLEREDSTYCSYVCADLLGLYPAVTPQRLLETLHKKGMI